MCDTGLHCPTCKTAAGGGAAIGLVVTGAVVVVAARHAITSAANTVVQVAEITACVVIAVAGAAIVGGIGYAAVLIRRHVLEARARQISPQVRAVITDVKAGRPVVMPEPLARPAIEAPRLQAEGWPLPGQWEEIRHRIGRDG